ncbi:SHOCT domain-containing protein [Alkalihalobacillus hwajinpoensis]|uniref:SHOCT domain-containing protein n=1 Tax=Guptibacillus hwajinpoensis TaxID=208199 RepID=UPI001883E85A|nr:SHOCT domain-containing protein [Pseudalkalibacillus hwajinpoensis]MBF0707856.1 SHOCT domain-containing protein [Pseudalkalibacillus hwajinpoensis]
MSSHFRVKPSKVSSMIGMIAGFLFVIIGIAFVSQIGAFGIVWTVFAIFITGYHALNVFSKNGVSTYQADVDRDDDKGASSDQDYESKIRQLHRLKEDHIITDEEYQKKKAELLNRKW